MITTPAAAPSLPPRWVLSLDTSTEVMAVAVQRDGVTNDRRAPVVVKTEMGGAHASTRLLPLVKAALMEAGATLDSIAAIAFARGPGAFTGLRTAVSVAQGLALGLDCPLLPLDSLMIAAEMTRRSMPMVGGARVWVAMDARMDQMYVGCYTWGEGGFTTTVAPYLTDAAALTMRWTTESTAFVSTSQDNVSTFVFVSASIPTVTAAGQGLDWPHHWQALTMDHPAGLQGVIEARGQALAALTSQRLVTDPLIDAVDALPLYVRDRVALTTAERDAAKRLAATHVNP